MPSRSRDDIAVNASVGEHERAQADTAHSGHRRAPAPGDPRLAAGAPFTNDVTKCQIVLLDRDARGRQLTDAQWDRLRAARQCVRPQPGERRRPAVHPLADL
ncbi:DUF6351 family protein [Streptomyces bobili]|uniref:DUF6351 family protein n=1 Tax=Streptomyces bobili TaxID=67280 RepID=UPI003717D830